MKVFNLGLVNKNNYKHSQVPSRLDINNKVFKTEINRVNSEETVKPNKLKPKYLKRMKNQIKKQFELSRKQIGIGCFFSYFLNYLLLLNFINKIAQQAQIDQYKTQIKKVQMELRRKRNVK